jgi:hypothetical protein
MTSQQKSAASRKLGEISEITNYKNLIYQLKENMILL